MSYLSISSLFLISVALWARKDYVAGSGTTRKFSFIQTAMTWNDAQAYCASIDMNLAYIDPQTNNYLTSVGGQKTGTFSADFWIGLYDSDTDDHSPASNDYLWVKDCVSLTESSWTWWANNEPSGMYYCAIAMEAAGFRWQMASCDTQRYFLCSHLVLDDESCADPTGECYSFSTNVTNATQTLKSIFPSVTCTSDAALKEASAAGTTSLTTPESTLASDTTTDATSKATTDVDATSQATKEADETTKTTTAGPTTTTTLPTTTITTTASSTTTKRHITKPNYNLSCCKCLNKTSVPAKNDSAVVEEKIVAEVIKVELTVDVANLSSTKRKKDSAPDQRVSSAIIGTIFIGVLLAGFACVIAVDAVKIFNDLKHGLSCRAKHDKKG